MPSAFGEHFGIAALCQRERRVDRFHVIHFHRAFLLILLEPLWKDKVLNPYSIDGVVVFLNRVADFQCEKTNSTSVLEMKRPGCVKVHVGIRDISSSSCDRVDVYSPASSMSSAAKM